MTTPTKIKVAPELHPVLADSPAGHFKTLFLKLNLLVFPDENEVVLAIDGPVSKAEFLADISPSRFQKWFGSKPEPFAFDIYLTQFVLEMELSGLESDTQMDFGHAQNITDAIARDREIERELASGREKKGLGLNAEWSASAAGPSGKLGLSLPFTPDKSESSTIRYKTTAKDLSFDAYLGATGKGPVWTFVSRVGEADMDMAEALGDAAFKVEALLGSFPASFLARLSLTGDTAPSVRIRVRPHFSQRSLHVQPSKDNAPSFLTELQRQAFATRIRKRFESLFRKEGIMTLNWTGAEIVT